MPQRLRVAAVFERGEKLFPKISKKPLALFCSWGIFLPVDGNEPNDADRRLAFERKVKSENENKNFSEKALDENENGVKINESLK